MNAVNQEEVGAINQEEVGAINQEEVGAVNQEEVVADHTLEEIFKILPKSIIDSLSPGPDFQWSLVKSGLNHYRISFGSWQNDQWVEVAYHNVSTVVSVPEIYDQFPVHRARSLDVAQMQQVLPQVEHMAYQPGQPDQGASQQLNNAEAGQQAEHNAWMGFIGANNVNGASQLSQPNASEHIMASSSAPEQYYQENAQQSQDFSQAGYINHSPLAANPDIYQENVATFPAQAGAIQSHDLGTQSPFQENGFHSQNIADDIVQAYDHNQHCLGLHHVVIPGSTRESPCYPDGTWDGTFTPCSADYGVGSLGSTHVPSIESDHEVALGNMNFMEYRLPDDIGLDSADSPVTSGFSSISSPSPDEDDVVLLSDSQRDESEGIAK